MSTGAQVGRTIYAVMPGFFFLDLPQPEASADASSDGFKDG
jgi:hypothetical protein